MSTSITPEQAHQTYQLLMQIVALCKGTAMRYEVKAVEHSTGEALYVVVDTQSNQAVTPPTTYGWAEMKCNRLNERGHS